MFHVNKMINLIFHTSKHTHTPSYTPMMSACFSYLVINVKIIRSTYIYLAVINMQLYFSLISCYENSVISLDCLK